MFSTVCGLQKTCSRLRLTLAVVDKVSHSLIEIEAPPPICSFRWCAVARVASGSWNIPTLVSRTPVVASMPVRNFYMSGILNYILLL